MISPGKWRSSQHWTLVRSSWTGCCWTTLPRARIYPEKWDQMILEVLPSQVFRGSVSNPIDSVAALTFEHTQSKSPFAWQQTRRLPRGSSVAQAGAGCQQLSFSLQEGLERTRSPLCGRWEQPSLPRPIRAAAGPRRLCARPVSSCCRWVCAGAWLGLE